jgi:hypothetical protein
VKSSNIWTDDRTEILWWVDDETDRPPFESFEESDRWEALAVDWLLGWCGWGKGDLLRVIYLLGTRSDGYSTLLQRSAILNGKGKGGHTKTTHHVEFRMNDPICQPCPISLEWGAYNTQGINGFPRLVAANKIAIIALLIS